GCPCPVATQIRAPRRLIRLDLGSASRSRSTNAEHAAAQETISRGDHIDVLWTHVKAGRAVAGPAERRRKPPPLVPQSVVAAFNRYAARIPHERHHKGGSRAVVHVVRRADLLQQAGVEDRDAVRKFERLL